MCQWIFTVYPVDMKPLREIASKHDLTIVEDAAQAHGATYKGKSAGAYADVACWSLYASKNMTTGEGGVVTTDDDELAEISANGQNAWRTGQVCFSDARLQLSNVRNSSCNRRSPIGLNCALFLAKRRENALSLSKILKKTGKLQLPVEPKGGKHSWYLYTVRIKGATENKRNKIVAELRKKGIGAEVYYINPIHQMPYYRENFGESRLPETEKAAKQVLSLPIHPVVTKEQIKYIGKTLLQLILSLVIFSVRALHNVAGFSFRMTW